MSMLVHTLHVVLSGVWLGGVIFTMAVVSPALKAMKWSETERVRIRSVIGKQYAKVGSVNLAMLTLFAVLDGLFTDFGPLLYAEYTLLILLAGLVALHGGYFGRRLAELAEAERKARVAGAARALADERRLLGKQSLWVSLLDLLISVVIAVLAVNA